MSEWIRKTYRVSEETNEKIKELMEIYKTRTENDLIKAVINDIYELKKSKALIPFEEYEKRDFELKKALLEVGRLKGVLEEKEKLLQEKEKLLQEKEKKKGFWARLFGL